MVFFTDLAVTGSCLHSADVLWPFQWWEQDMDSTAQTKDHSSPAETPQPRSDLHMTHPNQHQTSTNSRPPGPQFENHCHRLCVRKHTHCWLPAHSPLVCNRASAQTQAKHTLLWTLETQHHQSPLSQVLPPLGVAPGICKHTHTHFSEQLIWQCLLFRTVLGHSTLSLLFGRTWTQWRSKSSTSNRS